MTLAEMKEYMPLILTFVAALLGAGGIGGALVAYWSKPKLKAEAETTLSTAILAYTNKLTTDNDKLRDTVDRLQKDLDRTQDGLRKVRDDLDASKDHAASLQDIIRALQTRRENDKVIIDKLVAALKVSDPNNPLILELQAMLTAAVNVETGRSQNL